MEERVAKLEKRVFELERHIHVIQRSAGALDLEFFDGTEGKFTPLTRIQMYMDERILTMSNLNCAIYFFYSPAAKPVDATGFDDNKFPHKTPAVAIFLEPRDGMARDIDPNELVSRGFKPKAFFFVLDTPYRNMQTIKEDAANNNEGERLNEYLKTLRTCYACGSSATLMDTITKKTFCSDKQCHPK